MSTTDPPEFLTLAQVAAALEVSYLTARTYVRAGLIPATKFGGRAHLVRRADLETFAKPRRGRPPAPKVEELE